MLTFKTLRDNLCENLKKEDLKELEEIRHMYMHT